MPPFFKTAFCCSRAFSLVFTSNSPEWHIYHCARSTNETLKHPTRSYDVKGLALLVPTSKKALSYHAHHDGIVSIGGQEGVIKFLLLFFQSECTNNAMHHQSTHHTTPQPSSNNLCKTSGIHYPLLIDVVILLKGLGIILHVSLQQLNIIIVNIITCRRIPHVN